MAGCASGPSFASHASCGRLPSLNSGHSSDRSHQAVQFCVVVHDPDWVEMDIALMDSIVPVEADRCSPEIKQLVWDGLQRLIAPPGSTQLVGPRMKRGVDPSVARMNPMRNGQPCNQVLVEQRANAPHAKLVRRLLVAASVRS